MDECKTMEDIKNKIANNVINDDSYCYHEDNELNPNKHHCPFSDYNDDTCDCDRSVTGCLFIMKQHLIKIKIQQWKSLNK
jgi:hypothetical protein